MRQAELLWVSGALEPQCVASHAVSSCRSAYLGQCYEQTHLTRCLQTVELAKQTMADTHMRGKKIPPTIPGTSIYPSCSLPAPPGLAGRHARLRIWWQIRGTDGLSVEHHLSCFFQPGCCQDQVQSHVAQHIQWEDEFYSKHYLSGQWVSS